MHLSIAHLKNNLGHCFFVFFGMQRGQPAKQPSLRLDLTITWSLVHAMRGHLGAGGHSLCLRLPHLLHEILHPFLSNLAGIELPAAHFIIMHLIFGHCLVSTGLLFLGTHLGHPTLHPNSFFLWNNSSSSAQVGSRHLYLGHGFLVDSFDSAGTQVGHPIGQPLVVVLCLITIPSAHIGFMHITLVIGHAGL